MKDSAIKLYEQIGSASQRMLEAARAADWDALIAAEAECAELIERVRSAPALELAPEEQRRKQQILSKILAQDAEIRDRVSPWMTELEALLAGVSRGYIARQHYGE